MFNWLPIGYRWYFWVRYHYRTCLWIGGILALVWMGALWYGVASVWHWHTASVACETMQADVPPETKEIQTYVKTKRILEKEGKRSSHDWREALHLIDACPAGVTYDSIRWEKSGWTLTGKAATREDVTKAVQRIKTHQKGREIHERQEQPLATQTVVFTISGRDKRSTSANPKDDDRH